LNDQVRFLFKKLKENPADGALMRDAGVLYWNLLEENVVGCIRDKADMGEFLKGNFDFINFGLSAEVINDSSQISQLINRGAPINPAIKLLLVSDWLVQAYSKTMAGDRKETLEKDVAIATMQMKRLEEEVAAAQQQRREIILKDGAGASIPESLKQIIEEMDGADTLFRHNQKIKKMQAKGVFLPVVEKRKHFERETQFATLTDHVDRFLSSLQPRESATAIRQYTSQAREAVTAIIENEEAISRLGNEIADVAKKQQTISVAELSSSMSTEIEYVRDLVRLSAKRIHVESCGVLKPGDSYFTMKELAECIERILEFDPLLFNNSRVQIFGIPAIVLVPGTGSALYDWKNNRILVPLTPPGGKFMASVAYGMIEYRLDVDETKELLTSYNKLPQHAGVKSIFHLKNELTKDYITWMTSEYSGYKNLARETRKWFEHEIAPNKNEIAVPLQLRSFFFTAESFNKKCKEIEQLLAQGAAACSEDVLWTAGILFYQQGKFERAMEFFKDLFARKSDFAAALYNCAHTCMKLMRKQEAMDCFNAYCKLNPQSWWATVAAEHIRRLQTGHAT